MEVVFYLKAPLCQGKAEKKKKKASKRQTKPRIKRGADGSFQDGCSRRMT
jgi:hypothetical protein